MIPVDDVPIAPHVEHGVVTDLLHRWVAGENAALDRLLPVIYEELRSVARSLVRHESADNTLQATGLVHETFMRLSRKQSGQWRTRGEFFAWAAKVMRHVLIDHARARRRAKRGGGAAHVCIDEHADAVAADGGDRDWLELMALDEALQRLERLDLQQAQVVELRFFGDLGVEETAEALGISAATVKRDWSTARLWLLRELKGRPVASQVTACIG